mmetsp:Transcript_26043/g.53303  ORF Transcript_26043/g.53303 Transcript_26043/m.53303 type:complete len:332 (-) Transcript_26043:242-1237(-)
MVSATFATANVVDFTTEDPTSVDPAAVTAAVASPITCVDKATSLAASAMGAGVFEMVAAASATTGDAGTGTAIVEALIGAMATSAFNSMDFTAAKSIFPSVMALVAPLSDTSVKPTIPKSAGLSAPTGSVTFAVSMATTRVTSSIAVLAAPTLSNASPVTGLRTGATASMEVSLNLLSFEASSVLIKSLVLAALESNDVMSLTSANCETGSASLISFTKFTFVSNTISFTAVPAVDFVFSTASTTSSSDLKPESEATLTTTSAADSTAFVDPGPSLVDDSRVATTCALSAFLIPSFTASPTVSMALSAALIDSPAPSFAYLISSNFDSRLS